VPLPDPGAQPKTRTTVGAPVSVSIVGNRAAAAVANDRARECVAANIADLIPSPPEVMMGEMLVDAAIQDEAAEQAAAGRDVPDGALN